MSHSKSHNSRYYAKKLRQKDSGSCMKLASFGFTSSKVQNSDRSPGNFSNIIITEDTSAPSPSSTAIDIHVSSPTESPIPETNESVIENSVSVTEPSQVVVGSSSVTTPYSDSESDEGSVDQSSPLKKQTKVDLRQDSSRYQLNYPWMYWSVLKDGYICKFCELIFIWVRNKVGRHWC